MDEFLKLDELIDPCLNGILNHDTGVLADLQQTVLNF